MSTLLDRRQRLIHLCVWSLERRFFQYALNLLPKDLVRTRGSQIQTLPPDDTDSLSGMLRWEPRLRVPILQRRNGRRRQTSASHDWDKRSANDPVRASGRPDPRDPRESGGGWILDGPVFPTTSAALLSAQ